MGHARCGGVAGCISMCEGTAPEFDDAQSLIGRWLDVLRPGYASVADIASPEDRQTALEKEVIHVSLENLLGYPFVKAAVEAETLSLHGLWADIADMDLPTFDGRIRHSAPAQTVHKTGDDHDLRGRLWTDCCLWPRTTWGRPSSSFSPWPSCPPLPGLT